MAARCERHATSHTAANRTERFGNQRLQRHCCKVRRSLIHPTLRFPQLSPSATLTASKTPINWRDAQQLGSFVFEKAFVNNVTATKGTPSIADHLRAT